MCLVAGCSPAPPGDRTALEYDKATGRLSKVVHDANKNGTNDTVSYMDGTRILRIELDFDENGKVERWDIYNPDRTLQKVGLSSRNDGVMDSQAFYSPEGVLQRIEVSTARNDRFNRVEFYSADNVLIRSEEDTNGDGRPDKWETYGRVEEPIPGLPAYSILSSAFDETGSGRPTRRLVFGTRGTIARVEVDPDGDGTFTAVRPTRKPAAP